jgi:hypothetical protein
MLALACAGLFAVAASAAPTGETAAPMSPQDTNPYITFSSSLKFYVWPQVVTPGGKLYYSTNAKTWNQHTSGNMEAAIDSSGVYKLYVRGTGNRRMTDPNNPGWQITAPNPATRVDCSGNLATLLDYATVTAGQHPPMDDYCFANLFEGCTLLSSAPSPPAANLTYACCRYMFADCTNLTNASALPATTLANECYNSMFKGCTALTRAPELPATNLALGCYGYMFQGCGSLTKAPALPATTLAPACYRQMFGSCGSLTKTPALPAMTLTSFCYGNMFYDCPGLTELPVLPATNLAANCYDKMFQRCTGIKVSTAGPGVQWSIPSNANATAATDWNYRMFDGTGGTFKGAPDIGTPYYYTLPGTFAELPGATNGLWLCEMSVLPAHSNTVVFTAGQTPPPPPGNPDSVNGLLLLAPPPAGPVRPLDTPAPSVTVQPLRMTDGTVFLGDGGWYCLCDNSACAWPDYAMIGCDTVSMAMNGVTGDTPLISKEDALEIFMARQPSIQCTITQPVVNVTFPFLYGKAIFSVRPCGAIGGVFGAEHAPWHEPDYDDSSLCGGIGCICDGGPRWDIGFNHSAVNTRNLSRIKTDNDDVDTTEHCLGVVWSAGEKVNLFGLLDDSYLNMPGKDKLSFTSDNLTVHDNGELLFGGNPKDLEPQISLVKLHYRPNEKTDVIFDKLWVVVNRPDTKTKFDNWYAQNADISWTTSLPRPFASITINISGGTTNVVNPEPNPSVIGGYWHPPEAKNTYMHHDAKYEMRSKPTSRGHGHQAMYDNLGALIETPIAAGTADIVAPINHRGQIKLSWGHWAGDVRPYIQALQLDGNPVHPTDTNQNFTRPCIYKGPNTDKYVERRPVLPTGTQP